MQLGNTIAKDGHDPAEAQGSAVAVESLKGKKSFQCNWTEKVQGRDPDMAYQINGITAVIGTLSHSHYNCLSRNIIQGVKGCLCNKNRGDGREEGECTCSVRPFLDEKSNYSIELLRSWDVGWATFVDPGIGWELLDGK